MCGVWCVVCNICVACLHYCCRAWKTTTQRIMTLTAQLIWEEHPHRSVSLYPVKYVGSDVVARACVCVCVCVCVAVTRPWLVIRFITLQDISEGLFKMQVGSQRHWNLYAKSFLQYGELTTQLAYAHPTHTYITHHGYDYTISVLYHHHISSLFLYM